MTATTNPKPAHSRAHAAEVAMIVRRGLVTVLLAAGLMVMPGVARASALTTVCASGCNFTSIQTAVNNSNPDDFIEVMPGTYPGQAVVTVPLHIFAPPSGPRPVITTSQSGSAVQIQPAAAGSTISHLDIRSTSMDNAALRADGAVKATDLVLTSTAGCAFLAGSAPSQLGPGVTATSSSSDFPCIIAGTGGAPDAVTGVTVNASSTRGVALDGAASLTDSTVNANEAVVAIGGTVRRTTLNGAGDGLRVVAGPATRVSDSVVTSSLDGGIAVLAWPGAALELRNVTAVASGSGSTGLGALSAAGPGGTGGQIDARNVIARGTANGASGEPGTPSGCAGPCAPGTVSLGYSNVNDPGGVIDTTTVGHNQSADPLLVNPVVGAAQDFHIASPNSPLIGAGTADASDGPSDRDGVPHPDPPAIGAYEYTGPPAAPSGTPAAGGAGGSAKTAPGGGSATTGPTSGRRKPIISQLAASHTVFAVASTSTPLRGRTAAHSKRGTTFLFGLDQPAMVTIVITTSARCRRTTPRTARNRRCARTVARLTRSGHAGFNKLPFSGRIRGRPLKRGDYRAVFAATSAGGTSDPKTLRFRIVRR